MINERGTIPRKSFTTMDKPSSFDGLFVYHQPSASTSLISNVLEIISLEFLSTCLFQNYYYLFSIEIDK